jgi:hypothetical protein
MPAFFAACDVVVVPSLNSTETFGLVQVEAMLCGTPSIASDLPGVRRPPRMTGMGEVVPIGDSSALAEASSASSNTAPLCATPAYQAAFSLERAERLRGCSRLLENRNTRRAQVAEAGARSASGAALGLATFGSSTFSPADLPVGRRCLLRSGRALLPSGVAAAFSPLDCGPRKEPAAG